MGENPYGIFTKYLYTLIRGRNGVLIPGLSLFAGPSFRDETVADPGFRLDVLLASFCLEFLAQLAYEDAQIFGLVCGLGSPDRGEQGAVGHNFSRMASQVEEQVEFFWGEMDGLAEDGDAVSVRIDYEVARLHRGRGAFGSAAQVGADPCKQFLDAEGLGDVVVCARVEGFDLGALVVPHGENEHRCRGMGSNGAVRTS